MRGRDVPGRAGQEPGGQHRGTSTPWAVGPGSRQGTAGTWVPWGWGWDCPTGATHGNVHRRHAPGVPANAPACLVNTSVVINIL